MTRNDDLAQRLEELARVLRSFSAGVQWLAFDAASADDEYETQPVHSVQVDGDGPQGPLNLATLVSRDFTSVDYIAADVADDGASLTLEVLGVARGVSVRAVASVRQPFAEAMLTSLNLRDGGATARADLTLSTLVALAQVDAQAPNPVQVDVPDTPGDTPSDPQQGTGAQPTPSGSETPSPTGPDPSTSSPQPDPAPSSELSSTDGGVPAPADGPSTTAPSETTTDPVSSQPESPADSGTGSAPAGPALPETGGAAGGLVTDDGPSQAPTEVPPSVPDPAPAATPQQPTQPDPAPAPTEQPPVQQTPSPQDPATLPDPTPSDPEGTPAPPTNTTEQPEAPAGTPAPQESPAQTTPVPDADGVQQQPTANGPTVAANDVTAPQEAADPASSASTAGSVDESPADQIARLQAQIAALQGSQQAPPTEGAQQPPAGETPTSVVTDDGPDQGTGEPGGTNIAAGQGAGDSGDPAGGGYTSSATTADL